MSEPPMPLAEAAFEYAAAFADLAKLARADGDDRDAATLVDQVEQAYDLDLADGVLEREGLTREDGFDPYAVDPDHADDDTLTSDPSHELIVSPVHGDTRRYRVGPNPDPGAPYLLTEAEYTGCAWRDQGTEGLTRVEIDGDVWHEADARDGVAETEAGP